MNSDKNSFKPLNTSILIIGLLVFAVVFSIIEINTEKRERKKNVDEITLKEMKENVTDFKKIKEKVHLGERVIVFDGQGEIDDYFNLSKVVLIEFRAEWCPYCKEFEEQFPEILKENNDLVIVQVDIDEHKRLSMQYGVMSTPTNLLFYKGKLVDRIVGALPTEQINIWLGQAIKANLFD